MRINYNLVLIALSFSGAAQASWFGGSNNNKEPEYTSWSASELSSWLASRRIPIPTATPGPSVAELQSLVSANWDAATETAASWSSEQTQWAVDQASNAQQAFLAQYGSLKQDAFDTWDDSHLRSFLVEQGVVSPSGTREQLALHAKQKWVQASSSASAYSASATSLASSASDAASTAVYGDKKALVSKSVSSLGTQASKSASSVAVEASAALDDTKDYIYSTWDDKALRAYLEDKGVIEPKKQATRNQLLQWMRDTYARAADPIWDAWSDSYIHQWLVEHSIIRSDAQKKRDELIAFMKQYYYGPQETVYSTWGESSMKAWLIEHGVIKSDAQLKREKLEKLLADNYTHAQDTIWGTWSDSQMKAWLVEHGYLRSDAQKTRDELIKLMQDKHAEYSARTAQYLTWPDARLRAYLRTHGVPEDALPTSRPGLLQEVRIRYVQTTTTAEALFGKVKEAINGGVEAAEEQLGKVLEVLTGGVESAKEKTGEKVQQGGESISSAGGKVQKTEL